MSEVAEGPETKVSGRPSRTAGSSLATASGTRPTIWSLAHDADVQVGNEGERPAALAGPAVEHEAAGLGDAGGAAGERAVELVEVVWREAVVLDQLDAVGTPGGGETGGHAQPARAVFLAQSRHAGRQLGLGDAVDGGPVFGHPLGEDRDDLLMGTIVGRAVGRGLGRGVGLGVYGSSEGCADPLQDHRPGIATRRRRRHRYLR